MGMWCRGLTCDPVKVETAGSNPVIPATEPLIAQSVAFILYKIPLYDHIIQFHHIAIIPIHTEGV